jgi:hypothetical protein
LPYLRMPPLYSAGSGWPLHWTPCKLAVRLYCMRRYSISLAHNLFYQSLFKRHMITVEMTATDDTRHTQKAHLISVQLIRRKQRGSLLPAALVGHLVGPKTRAC